MERKFPQDDIFTNQLQHYSLGKILKPVNPPNQAVWILNFRLGAIKNVKKSSAKVSDKF